MISQAIQKPCPRGVYRFQVSPFHHQIVFTGGLPPPRPRSPLHTERLHLSGSLFFFGTKILVPGPWYQDLGTKILVPRSWYQDLVPRSWHGQAWHGTEIFGTARILRARHGNIWHGTDPPDLGTARHGTSLLVRRQGFDLYLTFLG